MPDSIPITITQQTTLLSAIHSPDALKKLTLDELQRVAVECRSEVINLVSVNGGHFASSLGVVVLTVALHHVYSTPRDKSRSTHFVVIEENSEIGGLGSGVIDHLNASGQHRSVLKVALPDAFVTHGHIDDLYRSIGFDTPTMTARIKQFYNDGQR